MGDSAQYNVGSRNLRGASMGYDKATADNLSGAFKQQASRVIHEGMKPMGVKLRESRDSDKHPVITSIILAMDVTGSMGGLPAELVNTGLPKIMGRLIEAGVDPALLFLAIGDHECDRFPIQIGQFETGDNELDMWLTRTYVEGGGGGNGGESYPLTWYTAAYLTKHDDWDKRKEKGFIFTIGDEPCLKNLPGTAVKEIFGENVGEKSNYTYEELYKAASERYKVFHIHINHGRSFWEGWKGLMGQHALQVNSVDEVAATIVKTVASNQGFSVPAKEKEQAASTSEGTDTTRITPML